jgi:hypothetical protein
MASVAPSGGTRTPPPGSKKGTPTPSDHGGDQPKKKKKMKIKLDAEGNPIKKVRRKKPLDPASEALNAALAPSLSVAEIKPEEQIYSNVLKDIADDTFANDRPVIFSQPTAHALFAMSLLPGGRIVSNGARGDVQIRNPFTGDVERTIKGHNDVVLALVMNHSGIFTAAADNVIRSYSLIDLELRFEFVGHENMITCMTIVPASRNTGLFSAGDDEVIFQWNTESGDEVAQLKGTKAPVNALASTDAHLVAAVSNGNVVVFDVIERFVIATLEDAHVGGAWALTIEDDKLFTGGSDGVIRVWELKNISNETPLQTLTGHRGAIHALLIDRGMLFSTGDDAFVCVWDTDFVDPLALIEDDGDGNRILPPVKPMEVLMPTLTHYTSVPQSGKAVDDADATKPAETTGDSDVGELHPMTPLNESTRDEFADKVERGTVTASRRTLQKRLTALCLKNNELVAVGLDRVIVKWEVTDLLDDPQEIEELPPLAGGVDKDHDAFLLMTPIERHRILSDMDVNLAVHRYQELPINFVIEALMTKVKGSWLTSELLPYIAFLIMFSIFVTTEIPTLEVFNMNKGVVDKIEGQSVGAFKETKSFWEVWNSEFYRVFLRGAFQEKLWELRPEGGAAESVMRFAGQNEIVGAIRFRTQRASSTSCTLNTDMFKQTVTSNNSDPSITAAACYGTVSVDDELTLQDETPYACAHDDSSVCTHNATEINEYFGSTSGKFEFDATAGAKLRALIWHPPGGFVADIPGSLPFAEADARINALFNNGFIDDVQTRFLIIEFFHYNPDLNLFGNNKLIAEVMPGGAFFMRTTHRPFRVHDAASSVGALVFEGFFFAFILYWFVSLFSDAVRHYRLYGNLFNYIFDVWVLMDAVNTIMFIVAFGLRWQWFSDSTKLSVRRPFDLTTYPAELDTLSDAYIMQININACNTILTFLKVLKYVQLNDKLNILTRTLALSQDNIIGVLGLFVYIVFGFAMVGYVLYGENVFGFRTVDASYNTLMRMLIGDMDYVELSNEQRGATLLFFWSFMVLAQYLLLNFLIAVLGDAFHEAVQDRLPIPMDDAILRAARKVMQAFSIKSLRITFILLYHRRSRTLLTAAHAKFFRERRELLLTEEARRAHDYDELEHSYVSRAEFMENVPELLQSSDNLNFMDEVWYDLAYEWHYRMQDAGNKTKHEQQDLVITVLRAKLSFIQTDAYQKQAHEMQRLAAALKRDRLRIEAQGVPQQVKAAVDAAKRLAEELVQGAGEAVDSVVQDAAVAVDKVAHEAAATADAVTDKLASVFNGGDKANDAGSRQPDEKKQGGGFGGMMAALPGAVTTAVASVIPGLKQDDDDALPERHEAQASATPSQPKEATPVPAMTPAPAATPPPESAPAVTEEAPAATEAVAAAEPEAAAATEEAAENAAGAEPVKEEGGAPAGTAGDASPQQDRTPAASSQLDISMSSPRIDDNDAEEAATEGDNDL